MQHDTRCFATVCPGCQSRWRAPAEAKVRGHAKAHKASRLDEQTSGEVLGDGLGEEAAHGVQCLAREHRVRPAVDDAVGGRSRHLDGAVEEVLLVGGAVLGDLLAALSESACLEKPNTEEEC